MTTDHRDRARQHLESARCLKGTDIPAEDRHLRYAQVHATLADRCPDPAAHQAEDTGELDSLRWQLTRALDLDEDDSDDEIVHTVRMRLASRDERYDRTRVLGDEVHRLRAELAEARASRPAPTPEVVAVVDKAEDQVVRWSGGYDVDDGLSPSMRSLRDAVRALPEGWRDGAAPAAVPADSILRDTLELIDAHGCGTFTASSGSRCFDKHSGLDRISTTGTADQWCDPCRARDALNRASAPASPAVPAVLDEAGVERVARLLAELRGVTGKQYDALPLFTKTAGIERARAAVRAYLAADTDSGSED